MAYTARELPPEEWARLEGLPIAENLPTPETASIFVIEEDATAQIIATWAALTTVHADGCWVNPAYQRNAAVIRAFTSGYFAMLRAHGIPQVLTVTQTNQTGTLAEKLGGVPLGTLWLIPVPSVEES
jgi:hypothetical protein